MDGVSHVHSGAALLLDVDSFQFTGHDCGFDSSCNCLFAVNLPE